MMPEVYKKCFIGLRLTDHDGNANTVQELKAMNIPVIHNGDDDNCPDTSNNDQADNDGDSEGDACDSDDDNDGLTDNFPDNCPRNGEFNWTSSRDFNDPANSTDWDNDGCKDDTAEDLDDDNDGVLDDDDDCQRTTYSPPRPTWVSDSTTDLDGDGCRDSDEDLDDDNDGFEDVSDDCPTVIGNSTLGTQGCIDSDGDMWSDTADDCPTEAGNSTEGGLKKKAV